MCHTSDGKMLYIISRKETIMPQPTLTSQQTLIDAAKAPNIAYNDKNWEAMRAAVATDVSYEELATHRKVKGVDPILALWQGWATALPDSKATFHTALVSGNSVVLEVTWRGTHKGPLQTPDGEVPATGKTIELPACQVIEIADGKVKSMRQYFDMATIMLQLGIAV